MDVWFCVIRRNRAGVFDVGSGSVAGFFERLHRAMAIFAAHDLIAFCEGAFIYGDYQDLDPTNEQVFFYTRSLGASSYLVILNFSSRSIDYTLPQGIQAKDFKLGNYKDSGDPAGATTLHLRPREARIYKN